MATWVRTLSLIFISGFLLGIAANGQEFRGSLIGRITDPSGAVLPGATVTAVHVETNARASTLTTGEGAYRIPFLMPGTYRIIVELAGFKKLEHPGVRISVGSDTSIDLVMQLGDIATTLTVTDEAPLVKAASGELGVVVEQTYVQNLPVSMSRNVLNKLMLTPGVMASSGTTSGTVTSNAQVNYAISGGGGNLARNEITIDGIPNTVPRSGGVVLFVPSQDSVEEMKVQTTLFDAAYGHSNAGAISINSRGGTNQLHGSAYDFKRWRALNANSWRFNRLGFEKPAVDFNQFGGTFGGPVFLPFLYKGRDRTFFMFAYERNMDKAPRVREARVPTELERNGDFSQTLSRRGTPLTNYNPFTTTGSGTAAKRLALSSIIPANLIDPTGRAVAKTFPLPNKSVLPQIAVPNWAASGTYQVLENSYSVRLDHIISPRQRLFGRYSRLTRLDEFVPVFFPGVYSIPPEGQADLGIQKRYFHNFALDDTITFAPTLVGSFRYGFGDRRLPKVVGVESGENLPDPAPLNLASIILQNQATKGFPIFNLNPTAAIAERIPQIGARKDIETWYTHTGQATIYKMWGKHSLKFGADYRLTRWNQKNLGDGQSGRFDFDSVFTRSNHATASTSDTSGTALASLLLGIPFTGQIGYSSPMSLQNHYLGLFVQDDLKLRPNLTLNFGLRFELETPYTERYNRTVYGFDPDAPPPPTLAVPNINLHGGVLFAGVGEYPRRQGDMDFNNFGPRFGFAYSINKKTVIRGGYGLFFSAQAYNTSFDGSIATFDAATTHVGTTDGGATVNWTLSQPFQAGLRKAEGNTKGLGARYGDTLTVFNQHRVNPYNQQWQLSIQRELPGKTVIEVAYVGMLTVKQLESYNLNELPDSYLSRKGEQSERETNPFLKIFDPLSVLGQGTQITKRQLWLPYPQYTTFTMDGLNTGTATYHAFQSRVEKRYNQGLSLHANYSFSKLMDNNRSSVVNIRDWASVSLYDRSHILRMAFVYEMPFGPGKSLASSAPAIIKHLIGGWGISGFLDVVSGAPLSVTHTNGRPYTLRNPSKSGPVKRRLGDVLDAVTNLPSNTYFDTTAFLPLPDQYTITPEPPYLDFLRGPSTKVFNLALYKNVSFMERLKLEIRAEAINALNTPNYGNPNTSMATPKLFGIIETCGDPRNIQIGVRLRF